MFAAASSASAASAVTALASRRRAQRRQLTKDHRQPGRHVTTATSDAHAVSDDDKAGTGGGVGIAALRKMWRDASILGVMGAAAASLSLTAPGPAAANVGYANDCDPVCHVLDNGGAKSQKMEQDMKAGGPDMGSAMEQLLAQRKAEAVAATKSAAEGSAAAKPRGF